jgi:hypothetical protein
VFVPSLSWQNDRFDVKVLQKRRSRIAPVRCLCLRHEERLLRRVREVEVGHRVVLYRHADEPAENALFLLNFP